VLGVLDFGKRIRDDSCPWGSGVRRRVVDEGCIGFPHPIPAEERHEWIASISLIGWCACDYESSSSELSRAPDWFDVGTGTGGEARRGPASIGVSGDDAVYWSTPCVRTRQRFLLRRDAQRGQSRGQTRIVAERWKGKKKRRCHPVARQVLLISHRGHGVWVVSRTRGSGGSSKIDARVSAGT